MVENTEKQIKVASPNFGDIPSILEDIKTVLLSGRLMAGPFSDAVEKKIKDDWDIKHAVTLNSCTTALQVALSYLGIRNKKVLVSTNTYVATGNAVLFEGGIPIFCDVAKNRLNMGVEQLEARLTNDTVGVVFTHIAGIVDPEFEAVNDFCQKKGLFLIEDCAHAHGEKIKDRCVGTSSQAGCFSFYPTKIITSGTGGLLITNDSGLDAYARSMRMHGMAEKNYHFDKSGNDWFMNEIIAVLALHQIGELNEFIAHRRKIVKRYKELVSDIPAISIFREGEGKSVYYKLPVLIESIELLRKVSQGLDRAFALECEPLYYPPCHMQDVFIKNFAVDIFPCPNAESQLARQFCLPVHSRITMDDVTLVANKIKELC